MAGLPCANARACGPSVNSGEGTRSSICHGPRMRATQVTSSLFSKISSWPALCGPPTATREMRPWVARTSRAMTDVIWREMSNPNLGGPHSRAMTPRELFLQASFREADAKPGGAKRDRTADLLHAMQALSQLSYGPVPCGRMSEAGNLKFETAVADGKSRFRFPMFRLPSLERRRVSARLPLYRRR